MEQETNPDGITYTMPLDGVEGAGFETNSTATSTFSSQNNESDVISLDIQCKEGHSCHFDIHKDDIVWELVEADEREMGTESHYEADVYLSCEECGSELNVIFHLWEYPDGVYNDSEIEVENGELIEVTNYEMIQRMFYQSNSDNHYDEE